MDNTELAKYYMKKICEINLCKTSPMDMTKKGIGLVLLYLYEHKNTDVTAGELAAKLSISTARIAVLIKKMEDKELIVKGKALDDGRITIVSLTDKGNELIEDIINNSINGMQKFISFMGKDDMDEIVRLLEKCKEYFESEEKHNV